MNNEHIEIKDLSIEDQFWIQFQNYKAKAQAFDKQNAYLESRLEQLQTESNPYATDMVAHEVNAAIIAGTKYLMHFNGEDIHD